MRSVFFFLPFLLLGLSSGLAGQPFYQASFTAGPDGYTPQGFVFSADGTAQGAPAWGQRSRIRSASLGGAMSFEGPGDLAVLRSPQIDLPPPNNGSLFLSFHQYFATIGGQVRVLVTNDFGGAVDTTLNLGLTPGSATSSGSYHLLDLTEDMAGATSVFVNFELINGGADFWIIDDVELSRTRPNPVTFPRYFGEALATFGLPFVVDSAGAPAVPFQLVADMLPGFSEAERQTFRDMIGATVVRSCVCDRLEVWEMPGGIFFDPVTGEPLGDPSDILGRTLPGSGMSKVDGLDLNYYNYDELVNLPDGPNPPLTAEQVAGLLPAPADAVRVAVLDTGLDIDHPDLNGYVFRDADSPNNGLDDDADCLTDNPVGWNYVDDNNNPDDDNGHGTHVSGIIARNLSRCGDCVIQLLPYKTHDSYGVGTLFATACAMLQAAVMDDADVINASWGFYGGGGDGILKSAIDTAASYGALVVAAAGNDSIFLDADPQYPALYASANIVTVGAVDTLPEGTRPLADFSNFSNAEVDLAAFGVDVTSSLLAGTTGTKSGTSMATPMAAAALCLINCDGQGSPTATAATLYGNTDGEVSLSDRVVGGRVLNRGDLCGRSDDEDSPMLSGFSICFPPGGTEIDIRALRNLGATDISIFNTGGGLVGRESVSSLMAGESVLVSLSGVPPGQYVVVITSAGRVYTQRLVKR